MTATANAIVTVAMVVEVVVEWRSFYAGVEMKNGIFMIIFCCG